MSVKSHTDGIQENLVDPGEPFVYWVVTELPWANSKKSTDSAQYSRLLGELFVD
jgi:hypothetical protein